MLYMALVGSEVPGMEPAMYRVSFTATAEISLHFSGNAGHGVHGLLASRSNFSITLRGFSAASPMTSIGVGSRGARGRSPP